MVGRQHPLPLPSRDYLTWAVFDSNFKQVTGLIYDGWLNEQLYFIGVKPEGHNDIYDARSWQKLDGIPEEYWDHRHREK